ncbi:dihydroorotate dehydrogenase electron transfer subunit [Lactovum odontotermitis]
MKMQELMTIVSQQEIAENIFELVLTGEIVSDMTVPGQFLHIKVPNDSLLLRRPISISEWDAENQTCTLIYRIGDETTGTWALSQMTAGEKLDVMGPLGNGFPTAQVTASEQILIVGGGIGVPPLYQLALALNRTGCQITVLLGFASQSVKFLEEKFKSLENVSLEIATDDGSYGFHGHVGQLLDTHCPNLNPDAVYACGAPLMLKAVAEKFENLDRLYISMESRMACGMGACYACVMPDKNNAQHALKVCEDGPVFLGKDVTF